MSEQDVVFGQTVEALPEGWVPIGVVCIVKCMDADGTGTEHTFLSTRVSDSVTLWEMVGMCECVAADARKQYLDALRDDEP